MPSKSTEKKADATTKTKKATATENGTHMNEHKIYEDIHFVDSTKPVWNYSLFSHEDTENFQRGTHYRLYELFGNKQFEVLGTWGTYFAVWAPNATRVCVTGNFNHWSKDAHEFFVRLDHSG